MCHSNCVTPAPPSMVTMTWASVTSQMRILPALSPEARVGRGVRAERVDQRTLVTGALCSSNVCNNCTVCGSTITTVDCEPYATSREVPQSKLPTFHCIGAPGITLGDISVFAISFVI